MIKEINKGQTLLVKGPTRVEILEGEVEIFGTVLNSNSNLSEESKSTVYTTFDERKALIVPSANRYPVYAREKAKLEIYTDNIEENLYLIDENSISDEWIKIKDSIIEDISKSSDKPVKIMVLGISSGKTTLIKYLINNFLKENLWGGYLDSDLGQQIVYLPTTINIGKVRNPIISSEDVETEDTVFVGATFPKGVFKFILAHYCNQLIDNFTSNHKDADFICIDADGWVRTEAGIVYKNFFIKTVDPDILVVFQDNEIEELNQILKTSKSKKGRKVYQINVNKEYFYEKSKEERRFLRQSQFAKVLENFRKQLIPLGDIKFVKANYVPESDKVIEEEIRVEELINLPYHYVIIGLMTEDSQLVNIGLLFVINIEKDYILLYSDFNYREQQKIKKILLGSLRLSTKGNHQGYLYL